MTPARPPPHTPPSLTPLIVYLFCVCQGESEAASLSLRAPSPLSCPSLAGFGFGFGLGIFLAFAHSPPAVAQPWLALCPLHPSPPPLSPPSPVWLAVRSPVCSCFGFDLFAFASSSITVQRCSNVLIIVDDHIVNLSYHYHHYHNHIVPTTPLYGNLDLRNTPLDLLY